MSELPIGWAHTSLGEITVLRGEKLDPATVPDTPFVGLEDIEPHTSRILKTGQGSDVKSSVARFSAGDVLYSRLRPYLNKVTIPDFDGVASAEVLVLQPTAATEAEFVRRRIMTREFLDFAALLDKGDRPRVNFKEIAEFPIALPPLPEQQRIVAKVDGLTARTARARKELDRIPTLIARYKQRLLALAFSGDLTAGWRVARGIKGSKQTKLVSDLITDVVGGKNLRCVERPPEPHERGVVKVSAVTWGEFNPLASKTLPTSFEPPEKTRIRSGDFLISRANTLELVAAVVIVKETPGNLYLSDKVLRLELPDEDKPWLLWFLRSPAGRSAIESRATGNQLSMRNLSQSGLRSIEMPWPIQSERAEIVRRIESAFSWLDRMAADHAAAARYLPKLDAAILAKAFRGELVPQDPNDEPASVLLEQLELRRQSLRDAAKGRRGRKPKGSKAQGMTEKPLAARDRLLKDSEKWPAVGLPFEAIAMRNAMPHDALRDALFDLLSGPSPALQQRFDTDAEVMVIQRVAA